MSLFDPGLQPERTELAWRRTALALAVGSLVAMRLLPAAFDDVWWTAAGASGLVVTAALFVGARRRFRQGYSALLRDGDRARMPGAALLLLLGAFVAAIGVVAVAVVIAVAVGRGG